MVDAPDLGRIKRNIGRMIEQNAPEADIDAYVKGEGVTPEILRATPAAPPTGAIEALGQGAAAGATLGWSDELQGALAAGGRGPQEPASLGTLVKGAYRLATGDPEAQQRYEVGRNEARTAAERAQTDRPGMYLAGNLGGAIATAPLMPLPGAGATVMGNIGRGAAAGAAYGAVQGAGDAKDMASIPAEAASGAVIGGGIGGAVPTVVAAVRRAASPMTIAPERQAMVDALQREGVDVTAGQATGSRPLRWAESTLGDMPGAGGVARALMDRQQEQFTGAALRRVGETANRATPDVIDSAFGRIGQQFDDLAARNTMQVDRQLAQDLIGAETNYQRLVPPSFRVPEVENTVNDLLSVASGRGQLDGAAYQDLRSRLDRASRGARADPPLSDALFALRNSLDDAMERSIQPADAGAWREARRQYRNMLVIEKAATGAGEDAALGLISPSQLRNAVVNQGLRTYARGGGDFGELARAGEAVMKPLPNSGTAPRSGVQNLVQLLAAGGGGAVAGLPGAIAAVAAPAVAGRALLSGPVQALLQRQAGRAPLDPATQRVVDALLAAPSRQQAVEHRPDLFGGR